jgi:hypothetical protein
MLFSSTPTERCKNMQWFGTKTQEDWPVPLSSAVCTVRSQFGSCDVGGEESPFEPHSSCLERERLEVNIYSSIK